MIGIAQELRVRALACMAGALAALSALSAGCGDTRISLEQLHALEARIVEQAAPVAVAPAALALSEVQRFRAAPGDVLKLTLIGLSETLEGTAIQARVDPAGAIQLPMAGTVPIAGQDLAQIERTIRQAYVPNYKSDVTVHVELADPTMITVIVNGAAGQRGLITLRSDKRNLLYALVQAEGFIRSASGVVHVKPARPEKPAALYNLNDINDLRLAMQSPPLESGDMITVEGGDPAAIYLTGLVNAPGPIVLEHGAHMTVMQAISASGGLVDALEPEEATLWRTLPNGERVRVKLALNDIRDGEAADVALRTGDILDVPHTAATRFRQWFAQNVQIGPFGVQGVYDPVAERRAKILRDDDDGGGVFQRIFLDTLQAGILTQVDNPALLGP